MNVFIWFVYYDHQDQNAQFSMVIGLILLAEAWICLWAANWLSFIISVANNLDCKIGKATKRASLIKGF